MKKKLEAELISIAHRILQMKDTTTLSQLQKESRLLYEKLTILTFTETHFAGSQPTIGQIKAVLETEAPDIVAPSPVEKDSQPVTSAVETAIDTVATPPQPAPPQEPIEEQQPEIVDTPEISGVESKPELIIEGINARVSEDLFIPASSATTSEDTTSPSMDAPATIEENTSETTATTNTANDLFFDKKKEDKPKSVHDQLKKEIHIGLNDRLAFIKYLFDGNALDYNRVLSQLNTLSSKSEAEHLINTMIKPDYHNWEGKEEYEERFMNAIFNKYDQ